MKRLNPYTSDWLNKWATYTPTATAIKDFEDGREYNYEEVNQFGNCVAQLMVGDWGLKKGDRVALLGENCVEMVFLFAAAQKTGLILVPLNWRLSPSEIAFLLSDACPKALVVQQKFLDQLKKNEDAQRQLDEIDHVQSMETEAMRKWMKDREEKKDLGKFSSVRVEEEDPIFILYTSGTTGFPKGAIYTHKMLFWNSVNTALRLDITSQDRTINVMPLFHTGGWNVLLTPFLHRGACTVLMKGFEPSVVLQALEAEKSSIFMGVPTMLNMMAEEKGFEEADLSSLRYMIVGGEAMPIPLIETYQQKGIPIRQGYGMTEAGPNLTSLSHQDAIRKKGSIGMPNFYVDIQIVDEKGIPLPAGNAGELLIKGPMVTPGYWQNEEATQKAIKNGWLHTGDMATIDEEGYLFIVDRIKNMYISGGENVYPAEVERILRLHPSVEETAVVPVPDPKWGESGKAFIKLREGKTVAEAELIQFCKSKLAKFKVPKQVLFLPELPKNGTGKIDRQILKSL